MYYVSRPERRGQVYTAAPHICSSRPVGNTSRGHRCIFGGVMEEPTWKMWGMWTLAAAEEALGDSSAAGLIYDNWLPGSVFPAAPLLLREDGGAALFPRVAPASQSSLVLTKYKRQPFSRSQLLPRSPADLWTPSSGGP